MLGVRTAIFAAVAFFAFPAAAEFVGNDPQNVGLTHPPPGPASSFPHLIDAVLRYSPPAWRADESAPSPQVVLPLHWAAITEQADVVAALLERGAAVDARDAEGRTPLMVAAAFDSRASADVLLAHGADPLARDFIDGNTPLDFAAMAGHADLARTLVAHGAPVDGRATRNGETPLHYASLYGRRKAIELLIGLGADINAADYSGVRPVQYARRRLQNAAVELLLGRGARPDNLHDAVNAGDVAHVQALIASGADVNAYDLSGTPLHLSVSTGQTWIAAMLIDAGADLEAEGEPGSAHPLHLAALGNHAAVARLLLDRGAEVDARDSQERTPLAVASVYGNAEVAKELILGAADTLASDVYADTPLHYAAMSGDIETADLLLSQGVDVNLRSGHDGEVPLSYAAAKGSVEMVAFLIERGADMNVRDDIGRTPLQHSLDKSKGREVVRLLRRMGAER